MSYDIELVRHPELNRTVMASLANDPTYEKLLVMYEAQKDKEQNQLQLFLKGETVLLSPKNIYLHLKYKTPFAKQLVAMASEMESFMTDKGK